MLCSNIRQLKVGIWEVNEIKSSDDCDHMGELDDEFSELLSDNEFLQINLDHTITIYTKKKGTGNG